MLGKEHGLFILALSCFAGGIAGAYLFPSVVLGVLFVSLGIVALCRVGRAQCSWLSILVLILFFLAGGVRASYEIDTKQYNPLDERVGEELTLEGVIAREVEHKPSYRQIIVYLEEYKTHVLVKSSWYPEYSHGDHLRITGELTYPEGFVGDTERFFDYRNFLQAQDIRYTISYADTERLERQPKPSLRGVLLELKEWFIREIQSMLPQPHASLLAGLLVGAKESMGEELLADFRATGVIHIVVLSGFNVTLVAWFFMSILSFIGPRIAAVVGSLAIFFFALMTGAGPTIVRASLMAVLVIIARLTGNYSHMLRLLFLAGALMLAYNPMLLLYSPSFGLSFMATLGLIVLAPYIERVFTVLPNPSCAPLRELVAATIATQLMVSPLLLHMTGEFPVYSPLANFLVLASVPYAMLAGFAMTLAGTISFAAALPLLVVTYALLEYELVVVELLARFPGAVLTVPPFSFAWVVAAYLAYAVLGYLYYKYKQPTLRESRLRLPEKGGD